MGPVSAEFSPPQLRRTRRNKGFYPRQKIWEATTQDKGIIDDMKQTLNNIELELMHNYDNYTPDVQTTECKNAQLATLAYFKSKYETAKAELISKHKTELAAKDAELTTQTAKYESLLFAANGMNMEFENLKSELVSAKAAWTSNTQLMQTIQTKIGQLQTGLQTQGAAVNYNNNFRANGTIYDGQNIQLDTAAVDALGQHGIGTGAKPAAANAEVPAFQFNPFTTGVQGKRTRR